MLALASKMCPAVHLFAEMNGTALFAECKLLPSEQDEFVNGYICIFCSVRVVD